MRNRRENRGFTLVELMAVVIIIGVLAAIAVPQWMSHVERAKKQTTQSNIKVLDSQLKLFKAECGHYPNSSEGLAALKTKPADFKGDYPRGGYIEGAIPKDGWGNDFVYNCPGSNGKSYDIISYGADGKAGGEDENADITNQE